MTLHGHVCFHHSSYPWHRFAVDVIPAHQCPRALVYEQTIRDDILAEFNLGKRITNEQYPSFWTYPDQLYALFRCKHVSVQPCWEEGLRANL